MKCCKLVQTSGVIVSFSCTKLDEHVTGGWLAGKGRPAFHRQKSDIVSTQFSDCTLSNKKYQVGGND